MGDCNSYFGIVYDEWMCENSTFNHTTEEGCGRSINIKYIYIYIYILYIYTTIDTLLHIQNASKNMNDGEVNNDAAK